MSGPSAEPSAGIHLGLETSEVRLAPYDPDWVVLGTQECATVRALLGDLAVDVMHAGSTAVPGIEAKPILDIVATVGDGVPIDDVVGRLCATGAYGYEGDQGDDGGLFLVRGTGELRTVHVHVVGTGSRAWVDYRRFHTLLINDAAARERYGTVKRALAQKYPHNRRAYTEAKSAVIRELLAAVDRPTKPETGTRTGTQAG
jgi:GrpB-like predicted nucleotidyltransferase (UPF0157 family)